MNRILSSSSFEVKLKFYSERMQPNVECSLLFYQSAGLLCTRRGIRSDHGGLPGHVIVDVFVGSFFFENENRCHG